MSIEYRPIGLIHSPFEKPAGMPIQPTGANGICGSVEVFPEFAPGLKDLDGFSHIFLLYHFHRSGAPELVVEPFLDSQPRGVFATRAPKRPNPIGISVVVLTKIVANILHIENVDILDGTPLLDIKPYVPAFDHHAVERFGWLERTSQQVQQAVSDKRFAESPAGGKQSNIP
ncbi:MAG: tRNA (N6-threonylcarbamoyladenosine(37)-N6)-methyltransferase TrmO [Desulfobacterales bacterium]